VTNAIINDLLNGPVHERLKDRIFADDEEQTAGYLAELRRILREEDDPIGLVRECVGDEFLCDTECTCGDDGASGERYS
jgi:hypothetical protein